MWISITEDHLKTVLAGPELASYRSAALAAEQSDPVAPTIEQVTRLVRGYVGACRRNRLGAGLTIPEKLLAPALDLLAVRMPQRVGQSPKEVRRIAEEQAVRLLEQVARGDFDIEEPAEVETTETSSAPSAPSLRANASHFSRRQQEGV